MKDYEYLKENQPLFLKLINNEIQKKEIPHSFLLVGKDTKIPLEYLTMALICDEQPPCEECIDCKRIKEKVYPDIIYFDGCEESIKKENVEFIRNEFNKVSVEGKARIYVLENIEYSTESAMNSLLKVLEEPSKGIYAIFTTKNKNKILPTIISRCQVLDLQTKSDEKIADNLKDLDLSQEEINILSSIYYDKEEIINAKEGNFNNLYLQAINFIDDLYNGKGNLVINTQLNVVNVYKDTADIKLFLNMVLLGLKDMFHVKHSNNIVYCNHRDIFLNYNSDNDDIIKKIELTLETINLLDTNANIPLLLDSYMYKL